MEDDLLSRLSQYPTDQREKILHLLEQSQGMHEKILASDEEARREFARLFQDVPFPIKPNDIVLIASGLISQGPLWAREPARVLKVARTTALVRFQELRGADNKQIEKWVHRNLIVDSISEE